MELQSINNRNKSLQQLQLSCSLGVLKIVHVLQYGDPEDTPTDVPPHSPSNLRRSNSINLETETDACHKS